MNKKLNESSIIQNYLTMMTPEGLTFTQVQMEMVFKGFFEGLAEYLGIVKTPDKVHAITVSDFKKNVLMAAYISYDGAADASDEDSKGSWEICVTFDPADIPEGAEIVDLREPVCYHAFNKSAKANNYYYKIESDLIIINSMIPSAIKQWLDANAVEGETVSIELDGVFTASVEIQDGVKVFGITIKEEVKDIAKGDRILSEIEVK